MGSNSYPGIISSEVYDLVQLEIKKRKSIKGYKTGGGCFSGKIVCGECGSFYGSKVWHSTSKYKRTIWQCNNKFKGPDKCKTPHFYDDDIKKAFVDAFNSFICNKEEILKNYDEMIHSLTDTSKLDMESARLQNECEVVTELIRKCVEDNARTALNQGDYISRYTSLVERYEAIKKDLDKIQEKRLEQSTKRERMFMFIHELETNDKLICEFDDNLWNATIEKVTVYYEDRIVFMFNDGMDFSW